jgi:hypothetical protein
MMKSYLAKGKVVMSAEKITFRFHTFRIRLQACLTENDEEGEDLSLTTNKEFTMK